MFFTKKRKRKRGEIEDAKKAAIASVVNIRHWIICLQKCVLFRNSLATVQRDSLDSLSFVIYIYLEVKASYKKNFPIGFHLFYFHDIGTKLGESKEIHCTYKLF